MKKFCLLVCALLVAGAMASCGGEHTHTFDTDWDKDAEGHWHAATCEHADQVADRGAHTDTNKDNICDVCGYIDSHVHTYEEGWTVTADNHYHKATCEHADVIKDEGKHKDTDRNGQCDTCDYDYGHTHTYADTWSSNETDHWYAVTCDHVIEVKDKAAHADVEKDGVCDVCAYVICGHTYDNAWSGDADSHWYAATCGCQVVKDQGAHVDDHLDGKCDVCAYDYAHEHTFAETWSTDEVDHWKMATCERGCEVSTDRGVHTDVDGNGACDICAYASAHFHTFEEIPAFDALNHWYKPLCEHTEVKGAVLPHADGDDDGMCDVCGFATRHTVTLTYPTYVKVTDANNNPMTGSFVLYNGETKTILVTVPDTAVLAMVWGATRMGDVIEVDGGQLYTYEISDLTADTEVKVAANKLVGAEVIVEKEATVELTGMLNFGTITFYAPAAGKYFVYDPTESGMEFGPVGATGISDYAPVYYFDVAEAGEVSVGVFYFDLMSSSPYMDYSYLICQFEDEFTMADTKGSGYTLPNNVLIKLTFVATAPGRYQIGSSASNLAWGDATATQLGDMVQGGSVIAEAAYAGQVITVTVIRESVAEVSFDFDWSILNLSENSEKQDVTVGDTPLTVPNGSYAAITFTVPADGSYSFAVSNFYSHIFLWMEEYETMYDMGSLYTVYDAVAGDVITLYLSAVDDNMDGDDEAMTDDVEDVLSVIDMGTIMGEDGEAQADADGEENRFMADYDGGDYIFSAPEGVTMSFDGGNTWVSEYTVTLTANQVLVFLVKTADGSETATLTVEQLSYWLDLEAVDNAATHTFIMYPDREYTLSVYGLASGSKLRITWGGADVTATMDGRPFAEGEVLEYSPWINGISLVLHADGPVEITLIING